MRWPGMNFPGLHSDVCFILCTSFFKILPCVRIFWDRSIITRFFLKIWPSLGSSGLPALVSVALGALAGAGATAFALRGRVAALAAAADVKIDAKVPRTEEEGVVEETNAPVVQFWTVRNVPYS